MMYTATIFHDLIGVGADIMASGALWKLLLFFIILMLMRGMYKLQRSSVNGIDFVDLIRDPITKTISPIRSFYVVGASITTVVYAIACTRPTATIQDINIFTVTYGGLWVLSQAGNKLAERPAPPATIIPTSSVNVTQNSPAPDTTGVQQ